MNEGCDSVQSAVLDESVPRGPGFEAHLATCSECTQVASAHRAALTLSGQVPLVSARRSMAETRRRGGVVVGLMLTVTGAASVWWLQRPGDLPTEFDQAVLEQPAPMRVVEEARPNDEAREWAALMQLSRAADTLVVAEYREEEVTRRVFGALPKWVAPRRTSPLRSLGRAVSPVVYSQEDAP